MPNLKETKKRISSVKSTQKITKAMQLVAASKFSRSFEKRNHAHKYRLHLDSLLTRSVLRASPEALYPFLLPSSLSDNSLSDSYLADNHLSTQELGGKSLLIVMAADRGLCGSLNAQVLKKAKETLTGYQPHLPSTEHPWSLPQLSQLTDHLSEKGFFTPKSPQKWELFLWGKKSWSLEKPLSESSVSTEIFLKESAGTRLDPKEIDALAKSLEECFCSGKWQRVVVVRAHFESALVQAAQVEELLPLPMQQIFSVGEMHELSASAANMIWEPEPTELVRMLVRQKIANCLTTGIIESQVCEHAARMTAMDHATQNAGEVIKNLTLEYNRGRQAAITTELVEITSGAEAL